MFIKLMSNEPTPDKNHDKTYTLVEVQSAEIKMAPDDPLYSPEKRWMIECIMKNGTYNQLPVRGNVYFLNDSGQTVDSFWPNQG